MCKPKNFCGAGWRLVFFLLANGRRADGPANANSVSIAWTMMFSNPQTAETDWQLITADNTAD
jgi:hypothetical protein